jgi:hypothetical protein
LAQSDIQVTVGSGTRLRTSTKVISSNTRHEQYHQLAEPDEETYTVTAGTTSMATANSHVLQIMAGSTLHVYVTRILVTQVVVATTAAFGRLGLYRLTTAGTGGSARTPNPLDTTDTAADATAMTLPTAKGTEGAELWLQTGMFIQTVPTGGPSHAPILMELDFEDLRSKSIRIPAGTSNGIALKNIEAIAGASVVVTAEFIERSY